MMHGMGVVARSMIRVCHIELNLSMHGMKGNIMIFLPTAKDIRHRRSH